MKVEPAQIWQRIPDNLFPHHSPGCALRVFNKTIGLSVFGDVNKINVAITDRADLMIEEVKRMDGLTAGGPQMQTTDQGDPQKVLQAAKHQFNYDEFKTVWTAAKATTPTRTTRAQRFGKQTPFDYDEYPVVWTETKVQTPVRTTRKERFGEQAEKQTTFDYDEFPTVTTKVEVHTPVRTIREERFEPVPKQAAFDYDEFPVVYNRASAKAPARSTRKERFGRTAEETLDGGQFAVGETEYTTAEAVSGHRSLRKERFESGGRLDDEVTKPAEGNYSKLI